MTEAAETFVDLIYRGLSLGRRIKLTQVRPQNGYLEHPTPMPVGTALTISTDDGLVLDAVVTSVHEQVGGSEVAPGMRFKPALATDQISTWWKARVTDTDPVLKPAAPAKSPTTPPMTVRPRTQTVPEPVPADAPTVPTVPVPTPVVAAPSAPIPKPVEAIVDARRTTVMNAVDQQLLESLAKNPDEIDRLQRRSGEYAVVDDGQRTMVMDAVDPAALGLDVTMSGSFPVAGDDEEDDDGPSTADSSPMAAGDDKKPGAKPKKRKKRR